jgi:hypothetical protein
VTKNADQRERGSSRDKAANTTRSAGSRSGVYLAAQHCHLVAKDQEFDVFGFAVAGGLGQHLQHLAQQEVHQRSAHRSESSQLTSMPTSLGTAGPAAEPDSRA